MADPATQGATVVYLSGTNFDGPQGTDRQLATALAGQSSVLWVDPPIPMQRARRRDGVAPLPGRQLRQLRTLGPPLITRPGVRSMTRRLYQAQVGRGLVGAGAVIGQVLTNPLQNFVAAPGTRLAFLTDDWVAGADLMGLDRTYVAATLRRNVADSDVLAAVTQHLLDQVLEATGFAGPTVVLPNACDASRYAVVRPRPPDAPERPYAVLVGQLNERLDLDVLQALVDSSVDLVVAGTNRGRTPAFARAYERLLASSHTHHLGQLVPDDLAAWVQHAHVGLTPYTPSPFNLASSPLKTWDYLAAGVPVVSTDLPDSRAIGSEVVVVDGPKQVVAAVHRLLRDDPATGAERRRALARANSWDRLGARLMKELCG